jgi:hypothetical protein
LTTFSAAIVSSAISMPSSVIVASTAHHSGSLKNQSLLLLGTNLKFLLDLPFVWPYVMGKYIPLSCVTLVMYALVLFGVLMVCRLLL